MKKASKVILIIAGVFGILISLAFLYLSILFAVGFFVETGFGIYAGIRQLINASSVEDALYSLSSTLFIFGLPGFIIFTCAVILLVGFLFMLLGAIFTLIASKKNSKKTHHIMSIVFNTFGVLTGLPFLYFGVIYTLYFIILFVVMLLLLITPIGWIFVSFIAISIGNIILFNIMLIGNIFGFIGIAKKKKEEENQPLEIIENVE